MGVVSRAEALRPPETCPSPGFARVAAGWFHAVRVALFGLLCGFAVGAEAWGRDFDFIVLNYHDIIDGEEERPPPFDRFAVSKRHFEDHLEWLRANGYHCVGVQDLVDAAAGRKSLPPKAVLLSFDDGYASFYTDALPLLKKYNAPAVLSLVGKWMDGTEREDVTAHKPLLTWPQVREIAGTKLVEIASHGYGLHGAVPAHPMGGTRPAAVTRRYDAGTKRYETEAEYRRRIASEMEKSADFLFHAIGIRPRVMVWPYGEYNDVTLDQARAAGMPITMGLVDGGNFLSDLGAVKRLILTDNPDAGTFSRIVTTRREGVGPERVVHVDLDYIHDPDPAQTRRNLDDLVERIRAMSVTTVYLQAFADPDGDGGADALYFPNRHLPVREDLFGYAAHMLRQNANVRIYAWMPMMAFVGDIPDEWYVHELNDGKTVLSKTHYKRLSPFHKEARKFIGDIFNDLAACCDFHGIVFHDDGLLSDFEDASPAALAHARDAWRLPASVEALRATPAMRMEWARQKSEFLARFTDELAEGVRSYRPRLKTARNMYPLPILEPGSEEWLAQSLPVFLKHYDHVAIEAMPFMEKAKDPEAWLRALVKQVAAHDGGLDKAVFELQSVDWEKSKPVPTNQFLGQIDLLLGLGAINIGYYPDNFHTNVPDLASTQKALSGARRP